MTPLQEKIVEAARASLISHYSWRDRGQAPFGYIAGMACAYAEVYARWKQAYPDALAMAVPLGSPLRDALAEYDEDGKLIPNIPILRQLFVLMMGLGMRESSGQYCCGIDTSADNDHGYDTEAGLFQTSYNITDLVPGIRGIFEVERVTPGVDLLPIFRQGVTCTAADLRNWGTDPGLTFQRLQKERPLFAVRAAALGLRGARSHWGPINTEKAEMRPEAAALFHAVETLVDEAGAGAQPAPGSPPVTPKPPEGTTAPPQTAQPIRRGAMGERVAILQSALRRQGAELQVDGDFGPITEQAVRQFQGASGLPITGIADDATMAKLMAAPPKPLPSVLAVAPHLATMRAITGTREIPGDADSPIILSWRKVIADAFPPMGSYAAQYVHDAIPWCGFGLGYCFAANGLPPPFGASDVERFMWAAAWGIDTPDLMVLPKNMLFPGAVMVFTRNGGGHVSIYEGEDDDYFHIRGCNQADMVNLTRFPKSQFTCASWPRSLPIPATNRVRMDASHNPISLKVT